MANLYISKQLKTARKASGLTQRDVYEWLGIGQSTFSAWETGQSEPSIGVFLKLCQKYGILDIASYFMPDSSRRDVWEDLDPLLLNKFLSLPERSKEAVKNCLEFEHRTAQQKQVPRRTRRRIPLYTQTAAAGLGNYLNDSDANICELDAPEDADFAIRISGDSMEPLMADDQIVFVRQQSQLMSGEIGIFIHNGESFCKMWDDRNGIPKLVSINTKYPPIRLKSSDTLHTCGKVLL